MKTHITILLFVVIIFSACTSERPPDRGAGISGQTGAQPASGPTAGPTADGGPYALVLKPGDARTNTTLSLEAEGFNPDDARIEWLINGGLPYPGENSGSLKGGIAKKGFTVRARAIIMNKEVVSNVINIKNTPPVISRVKWTPEVFKPGDRLGVEVSGTDTDGDEVTFTFEWKKNGEPAGNGDHIDSVVKRGDKVSVKITPFDGEEYGRAGTLSNEVRNIPPMIIDDKDFKFDGSVLTHQIKAVDPDDDPVTYSLKNPPQGMTIDAATGLVTWRVPDGYSEKGSYTAVAKDPNNGESFQIFNFDLSR